jgi:hypothetical protein
MEPDELEPDICELWGPQMAIPGGYIVEPGEGEYRHRVGGSSWQVVDPNSVYGGPTLFLTLDLSDPRLASVQLSDTDELPLASYMNCGAWGKRQVYCIEPERHVLRMVHREAVSPRPLPEELQFPNPLPETMVHLRPMNQSDWPLDSDSYSRVFEEFAGGSSFIRILGPPLWVYRPWEETCSCGAAMAYVCGFGYELQLPDKPHLSGYIPGGKFYYGEGVLYFFLCQRCREIVVQSQST